MIYLFGSPGHSNLGDQAQTYCIQKWCEKFLPGYGILIFQMETSTPFLLKILRRTIQKNDIIFCHSGYHITDLYDEKRVYCDVINSFPDFVITVFPQTVYFQDEREARRIAEIFDGHKNLTLLCRDEISYQTAQELFKNTRLILYPDVVTSLIGTMRYCLPREGILICKRSDKEAFYTDEKIASLSAKLRKFTKVAMNDTTINLDWRIIAKNREKILNGVFAEFARYQAVITDRYHGTIFSLIAQTPVIALASTDHKLSSGLLWFPQEFFGEYVHFAENENAAIETAKKIIANPPKGKLPPYFKDNYFDVLLEKLTIGDC